MDLHPLKRGSLEKDWLVPTACPRNSGGGDGETEEESYGVEGDDETESHQSKGFRRKNTVWVGTVECPAAQFERPSGITCGSDGRSVFVTDGRRVIQLQKLKARYTRKHELVASAEVAVVCEVGAGFAPLRGWSRSCS